MFSSRAPKLIGAALMDLAEAMLRPVDADGLEHAVENRALVRDRHTAPAAVGQSLQGDDWLVEQLFTGELAPRPGRAPEPLHSQRATRRTEPLLQRPDRSRRPGMVDRAEQPCVSPLPSRTLTRGNHTS